MMEGVLTMSYDPLYNFLTEYTLTNFVERVTRYYEKTITSVKEEWLIDLKNDMEKFKIETLYVSGLNLALKLEKILKIEVESINSKFFKNRIPCCYCQRYNCSVEKMSTVSRKFFYIGMSVECEKKYVI